ncbi:MAG: hypothetical protein K1X79_11770 [Oligoflexia bacterium]|nr:hypothetical protein [Oligoflexia bacterium]
MDPNHGRLTHFIHGMVVGVFLSSSHMDALPTYFSGLLGILLLSAFVRVFVALNVLRYGLGMSGAGFGFVITAFAFCLSLFVVEPQLATYGGYEALLTGHLKATATVESTFRPFIEKHTDVRVTERVRKLNDKMRDVPPSIETKDKGAAVPPPLSFGAMIVAFLVSELTLAVKLGLMFIVPFVVLDLLVANALMALGATQVPLQLVSLPLKLLLFFAADGWMLVTQKLLGAYT